MARTVGVEPQNRIFCACQRCGTVNEIPSIEFDGVRVPILDSNVGFCRPPEYVFDCDNCGFENRIDATLNSYPMEGTN